MNAAKDSTSGCVRHERVFPRISFGPKDPNKALDAYLSTHPPPIKNTIKNIIIVLFQTKSFE